MDLLTAFVGHARRSPAAPLLVAASRTLTYGDVASICARIAAGLVADGVVPGSRIGVVSYRGLASPLVYLAAQFVRARPVLVPWGLVQDLGALCAEHGFTHVYVDDDLDVGPLPAGVRIRRASDLPEPGEELPTAPTRGPGELASIQFSTGTTGRPKPMIRTVSVDYFDAVNYSLAIGLRENERWLTPSPKNINVAVGALRRMLLMGGAVVLMDEWSIPALDEAVAGGITLVPQMTPGWQQIIDADRLGMLVERGMRTALATGQRTPASILRSIRAALPPDGQLVDYYGTTEASTLTVNSSRAPGFDEPGVVGVPAPLVELEIRPHSALVGAGDVGEVWARSLATSPGYAFPDSPWNADPLYDAGLIEPWFATGDAGTWTASGQLALFGRIGDVIASVDGPIFPLRVEAALSEIAGVREVAVLASDRADAAVLIAGTAVEDEVREALRTISSVEVHRIDRLPRNPSDKVNRPAAGEWAAGRDPELMIGVQRESVKATRSART